MPLAKMAEGWNSKHPKRVLSRCKKLCLCGERESVEQRREGIPPKR